MIDSFDNFVFSVSEISIDEQEGSELLQIDLDGLIALCLEKANSILIKSNNICMEMKKKEFTIANDNMNADLERDQLKAKIIILLQKVSWAYLFK